MTAQGGKPGQDGGVGRAGWWSRRREAVDKRRFTLDRAVDVLGRAGEKWRAGRGLGWRGLGKPVAGGGDRRGGMRITTPHLERAGGELARINGSPGENQGESGSRGEDKPGAGAVGAVESAGKWRGKTDGRDPGEEVGKTLVPKRRR